MSSTAPPAAPPPAALSSPLVVPSAASLLRGLEQVSSQEELVKQLETFVGLCAKDAAFRVQAARLGSLLFALMHEHMTAPLLTAPPRLLLFKLLAVFASDPASTRCVDLCCFLHVPSCVA